MSEHYFYIDYIYQTLCRELETCKAELSTLPQGSLYLKSGCNGDRLCWRRNAAQTDSGIRKEQILHEPDRELAEGLQRRHFLTEKISRMEHDLKLLSSVRARYLPSDMKTVLKSLPSVYSKPLTHSGFQKKSTISPSSDVPDTFHPEHLIHKNSLGECFRSKSEVQISEILNDLNLPYTYEPQLTLGDKTIRPDFLIHHPVTGDAIYIEYFGMVDNPDYSMRMLEKMRLYLDNKFRPGIDLLFLFETPRSGMNLAAVRKAIEQLIE